MAVTSTTKTSRTTTTEQSVVECVRCHHTMQVVPSAKAGLHYLVCPGCRTRLASAYDEVFRSGAATRVRRGERVEAGGADRWERIRLQADRWNARLDSSDPFRILGVNPGSDFRTVRARYYELAARHHPDRGGDAAQMRQVIEAYKLIRTKMARSIPA